MLYLQFALGEGRLGGLETLGWSVDTSVFVGVFQCVQHHGCLRVGVVEEGRQVGRPLCGGAFISRQLLVNLFLLWNFNY